MSGKRRLIWHIFPPYLMIIIIALIAVIFYASISIKRFYVNQTRVDLQARAVLIQSQIVNLLEPLNEKAVDAFCKNAGKHSATRITVIFPNGMVIGDSEAEPNSMDNHIDRPEFIQALTKSMGTSIRYSRTLDQNFMYVGIPVQKNHELLAVIRTSIPIDILDSAIKEIQCRIIFGGLVITLLAALISLSSSSSESH